MKLTITPFNQCVPARIIARMTNKTLEVENGVGFTAKAGLVTSEGSIQETYAIAKYMAHGHATLLGSSNEERAKMDQWCMWGYTTLVPCQFDASMAIYGHKEVSQAAFTASVNALKQHAKDLNANLKGKSWLVGDNVTLADLSVATQLVFAMQCVLDGGFRKAMPDLSAWFERVCALPDWVAINGNIKACQKGIKPQIKAEPKKEVKKAAAAPKPKADDGEDAPAKKPKSALETLPPTEFDLFNFKTFMVNVPDKKGEGIDELKKLMDKEGFSIWFLHYEMYKDEGTVLFKTENMCKGFLQRFDDFRKWCLARHLVLGTEDKQEIMGVWLWRGVGIPQEAHDHPQFEYYKVRQMDIFNNAEDDKLIRAFWGATYEDTVMDMPVLSINWHK